MRGWLMIAIGVLTLAGCEAPSDPAPAAQSDPLEEAIARGRFPDEVARVLRRLATLPPGSPSDVAGAHLGLPREPDGGWALTETYLSYWNVAPGYRVEVVSCDVFETRSDKVVWVSIEVQQESSNPDHYTRVGPYWSGGHMRYD
jgi:hypothetical protein